MVYLIEMRVAIRPTPDAAFGGVSLLTNVITVFYGRHRAFEYN
jgi:hypothetical protein